MSFKLRYSISEKIFSIINYQNLTTSYVTKLSSNFELKYKHHPEFHLTMPADISISNKNDLISTLKSDLISNIEFNNQKLVLQLNPVNLIKNILSDNNLHIKYDNPKRIVVEFSSPNIAKPFHVGHLRSTIIGNFISNIEKNFNQNIVTKINYLGDWGTQFGLLKVGMDLLNPSLEQIQQNPINTLYNAYVYANKLAEKDVKISEKARSIFLQMEDENLDDLEKWEIYRKFTIDELEKVYNRLGVQFDTYEWESNYKKNYINEILNILKENNLIELQTDGVQVINAIDRKIPIIKSDGTTLYLTRDVAAITQRYEKYNFNKIYYVVDNGQTDHFRALKSIGSQLKSDWSARMEHIKFGRIKGMSTRQGNVIFLSDILDEAMEIMLKKQVQSPTTKIDLNTLDKSVADCLGISAVIVNDLKQRRQRDYNFDWSKALQVNGDTGIKLQYTHCRLCSLLEKFQEFYLDEDKISLNYLSEPIAHQLCYEIGRYTEILYKSHETMESCILVNYLFLLSNLISRALKLLNVKNESCENTQLHRIILFRKSRLILNDGMKILGLKPLEKM